MENELKLTISHLCKSIIIRYRYDTNRIHSTMYCNICYYEIQFSIINYKFSIKAYNTCAYAVSLEQLQNMLRLAKYSSLIVG